MKLKNKYILRNVADKTVAIALENSGEQTEGVLTLNDTGAFIFGLMNDGADKSAIVEKFFSEYDVTKEEAEKSVDSFMESLKNTGLVEE